MRQILITQEINQKNTKDVIEKLTQWIRKDDEQDNKLKNYTREPIDVLINTFGGDVHTSMGIADIIRHSKTHINTVCIGSAMSGGFFILIAGHTRKAYPMSTMMYHQLSHRIWGTLTELKSNVEWDTTLQDTLDKFVVERTQMKKEELDEYNSKQKDWYMMAE